MAQQQQDGSDNFVWGLFALCIVFFIISYKFGDQIKMAYLHLKVLEGQIVTMFYDFGNLDKAVSYVSNQDYATMDAKKATLFGKMVGKIWMWPGVTLMIYLWYRTQRNNPFSRYTRVHTMNSLAKVEAVTWPWITPVLNLDLVKVDIEKGKWAMALKPLDFAQKYKLLDDNKSLIQEQAEKIFVAQLGPLWEGPEKLPDYVQALFAIFLAYGCYDKKGGEDAIRKLAVSFAADKPDYSFVKGLMEKHWYRYKDGRPKKFASEEDKKHYQKYEEALRRCSSHAYVYTVFPSMLEFARETGVLPSNYWVWLRPKARTLWYILNTVGRKVAVCEVAGIYCHWLAESVVGKKIEMPYVEKAVTGLRVELTQIKF